MLVGFLSTLITREAVVCGYRNALRKKPFGCKSAAVLILEEIACLAGRVNSSIQIHPPAFDFDMGLIDSPGIISLFQIWAASFIEFWSV